MSKLSSVEKVAAARKFTSLPRKHMHDLAHPLDLLEPGDQKLSHDAFLGEVLRRAQARGKVDDLFRAALKVAR